MAFTVSRTFSSRPGPAEAGTPSVEDNQAQRSRGRIRHAFWRRERQTFSGWVCPGCGSLIRDPAAARLGFCSRCHDFTGLCAAGRRIVCPDVMTVTTWHTPCTRLGVAAWRVMESGNERVVLLCQAHDEQLLDGEPSWLPEATPVEGPIRW